MAACPCPCHTDPDLEGIASKCPCESIILAEAEADHQADCACPDCIAQARRDEALGEADSPVLAAIAEVEREARAEALPDTFKACPEADACGACNDCAD